MMINQLQANDNSSKRAPFNFINIIKHIINLNDNSIIIESYSNR